MTMDHLELTIYLKELEESMYEWDDSPASWQLELEKVQNIIKQLMDDTSKEADKNKRVMFAMLVLSQLLSISILSGGEATHGGSPSLIQITTTGR